MKTLRKHECTRPHHDVRQLARCIVPTATSVTGQGTFATVSRCRSATVTLWPTDADAQAALAWLDAHGCGSDCRGHHAVIRLGS